MKPRTVAHFRIESTLGSGGMGEVFLATDTRLDRKVALKLLKPGAAASTGLLTEARIASAIQHPNVAAIYDVGESSGCTYIAMEFVDGQPLSARIDGATIPLRELVAIGCQIAEALDAAHQAGVIHRDIKPGNVLVTPRGVAKVVDFGLAVMRPRHAAGEKTQALAELGLTAGTIQYMSPEQALGRPTDARSDIFSLGVVLYEMATGAAPFDSESAQECLARVLEAAPEPVLKRNPKQPAALGEVIERCLSRDPENRFPTARSVADALKGVLTGGISATVAKLEHPAVAPISTAPLRVAIVDDEELARLLMRDYLKNAPGVEIVAECANGFEAVKAVSEHKPDLVFLDVQMPKLDGFEVLELIGDSIPVIFATAYDQYAMKAFDAHAVDYLLKPFSQDRLLTALARARERIGQKVAPAPVDEIVRDARAPEEFAERLVIRDGSRVTIIPAEKLDYVLAQDDYVELHSQKKAYLKQQTISSLEASLNPKRFLRIHRSAIINLERIARIEPYGKDSRVAVLNDGTQLPVSRSGYARLKEILGERA